MSAETRLIVSRDTLAVVVFLSFCLLLELPVLHPHERPTPMQVVTLSNGTSVAVKNLIMDHKFVPAGQQIFPSALLFALCVLVPTGVLLIASCHSPKPGEAASFMRGYMMALACMLITTDFAKSYVGYLRPYFYDQCGFDPVTRRCTHDKAEAHKSFPSGHASTSFCAMLFTSLFLLKKVSGTYAKVNTCLGTQDCTNVLLLLAVSPVMLAFWIACSRVRENDHHPADIVFGAFIGSGWALFWFARYFLRKPSPTAETCSTSSADTRHAEEDVPMTP